MSLPYTCVVNVTVEAPPLPLGAAAAVPDVGAAVDGPAASSTAAAATAICAPTMVPARRARTCMNITIFVCFFQRQEEMMKKGRVEGFVVCCRFTSRCLRDAEYTYAMTGNSNEMSARKHRVLCLKIRSIKFVFPAKKNIYKKKRSSLISSHFKYCPFTVVRKR